MKDKDTNHGDKFTFNNDVTDVFGDMLERSIPTYSLMRELVETIVEYKIIRGGIVLDIGTSTGESFKNLAVKYPNVRFIGLEISDPMIEKAQENFKAFPNVEIRKHDLRSTIYLPDQADVIISCLTIQFTPIEYRLQILANLYGLLTNTGSLVLVEKVIGNSAKIDKMMVSLYNDMKEKNGYSYEEIKRKKMALEGILVPVTSKWNEELLEMSNFKDIDCFWRCLNFAGWVAHK